MAKKKKERSASPKLGAQYQAAKLGVAVAGGPAHSLLLEKSSEKAITRVSGRDGNYAWHKGVAVSLLDQYGSKKLGHAAALSRGSITAMAPEIIEGIDGAQAADLDPVGSLSNVNAAFTGYSIQDNTFDAGRVSRYGLTKYGLGIGRKVVNKTRAAEPIKKFLSMLGLSL